MDGETVVLVALGIAALLLMTQRWFWLLVFGFSGLASLFAMLASIIHFQILGALGFFMLMSISWSIAGAVASRY
ncbi:MAG: hypothetical protein ABIR56_00940 [Polaromonas sp.]